MGRLRSERGSVTVFAVGVLVLGFLLVVALAAVGQVLIARSRVVTAAEAGALAAAPVTFRPFGAAGSATAEAALLVRANGAELLSCSCSHDPGYAPRTVTVTARLPVTVLGLGEMTLEADPDRLPTALLSTGLPAVIVLILISMRGVEGGRSSKSSPVLDVCVLVVARIVRFGR